MTDIILTVPFVSQLNIGGSPLAGGRHDPTGCWYAAISMLGYYREIGPRLGVPEQYVRPDGTPQKTDLGFQGGRGATASLAMGHSDWVRAQADCRQTSVRAIRSSRGPA
jgi:hypothetical protein